MSTRETAAEREVLAEGKFLAFVREGRWEYVERRGVRDVVFVVAVTTDGRPVRTSMSPENSPFVCFATKLPVRPSLIVISPSRTTNMHTLGCPASHTISPAGTRMRSPNGSSPEIW